MNSPMIALFLLVLFREVRTGGSDMDIFMVSAEKEVDLTGFEGGLGHKISLHVAEHFSSLSKELHNKIVNGIKLYGYLDAFA